MEPLSQPVEDHSEDAYELARRHWVGLIWLAGLVGIVAAPVTFLFIFVPGVLILPGTTAQAAYHREAFNGSLLACGIVQWAASVFIWVASIRVWLLSKYPPLARPAFWWSLLAALALPVSIIATCVAFSLTFVGQTE